jgi:hypothetical protein
MSPSPCAPAPLKLCFVLATLWSLFGAEPGTFTVFVGTSSVSVREAHFELAD